MNIIGILSLILVPGTYGCTDKDAVQTLPDLQRRASTYSAGSTLDEPLVNDIFLSAGWYRVYSYTMATGSVPELGFCGTLYPIYILGDAPENSTIPDNTAVEFVACLRSIFDNCDLTYNITVRNSSGELQYYLEYTERHSAYCFNPTGTVPAGIPTDVSLGEITVEPKLRFYKKKGFNGDNINIPFLEFECNFNQQPEYFYSVKWYSNDELIERLGPSQNMSYLSLKEKCLNLKLGVNFQCGVSVSAAEDGLQTATEFSSKYFAGIKFNNLTIYLNRKTNASVTFKITVPIGCPYSETGTSVCLHDLRMFERTDNCSNLVAQSVCGVRIPSLQEGEAWDPDKEYSISIVKGGSYGDGKAFILDFRTERFGHMIWREYQPDSVNVIITDTGVNKHKYCYSLVDPHMRTSDGVTYEHHRLGTYVLYRNTKYNIEVQERTHSCNNNHATCVCGVVIRAGADILTLDKCDHRQTIRFKECNDGGILRIKPINKYLYQVYTPIGTYIEILLKTIYEGSIDVFIYMSPKDYNNVVGLCGVFDGNTRNDFTTPGGEVLPDNRDNKFSESWKLNQTDPDNMFRIDYKSPKTWSQENALFCYCNNTSVENTTDETTYSTREGCIVSNSKDVTDKLCTVVLAKKRRSISKRFALDTGTTHSKLTKRSAVNITDDEANTTCTDTIGSALVATDFTDLLAPGEVEAKIEQCIYDVLDSGDLKAATAHVDALNMIATFHMDIDPEYVVNNIVKVAVFKQQSCLSNCSSQGTCVDGECQCVDHYHGADCSIDERNPLIIDGVTDDGVCDKVNSDCNCFHVETDNLIETFKFQYVKSEMDEKETYSLIESISGNGEYLTLFEGIVCLDSSTNKQAFVTHYNLSISNDGITYSDPAEIYVYDSTCQQYTSNSNGRYNFNVMNGHCYISGVCYVENHESRDKACSVCLPSYSTTDWTFACSTEKMEEGKSFVIIIAGVVGGIVALAVVGIVVYCVKKSKKKTGCGDAYSNRQAIENEHAYERPQSAMSTRTYAEIDVMFHDNLNEESSGGMEYCGLSMERMGSSIYEDLVQEFQYNHSGTDISERNTGLQNKNVRFQRVE